MSESKENQFKFILYQGDEVINTKIFYAEPYLSVDIRSIISNIIVTLQKTLSRRNLEYSYMSYDFVKSYKKIVDSYDSTKKIGNLLNKIKNSGVEFKFGLYLNGNPIVERNFYVDKYNPTSRLSFQLTDAINDICDDISMLVKKMDEKHIWNEYDVINTYNLHINQIRAMSKQNFNELLNRMSDKEYVKKMKYTLKKNYYNNVSTN